MGNNNHKVPQSTEDIENDRIHQYTRKIPKEIRDTITALDDDSRLAIIGALMDKGKMTFTGLKDTFGMDSSSLSCHLTLLQDGGLVDNSLEISSKGQQHSYYKTTDITESLLTSLHDIMISVPKQQQEPPTTDLEAPRTMIDKLAQLPTNMVIIGEASIGRTELALDFLHGIGSMTRLEEQVMKKQLTT